MRRSRKILGILMSLAFCLSLFSSCGSGAKKVEGYPQIDGTTREGDVTAVMEVEDYGTIKLVLYGSVAPKAVENFVKLAQKGYYDGLTFHRVMEEFMIQGGDPNGNGTGGESIWGGKFDDEISASLYHFRGALCYANSGPDSNGSQFYIVQCTENGYADEDFDYYEEYAKQVLDYEKQNNVYKSGYPHCTDYPDEVREYYRQVGGYPYLDSSYTIFGQVLEGMDVVDAIAAVEVNAENNCPVQPVVIRSITIEE